jgi:3-isopropylmalate/(R)-2-methylmalate dehydratase small subunit
MSGTNMLVCKVWKFGDNINTDLMLPGPYLFRSEAEQARAVFMNNRPEWLGAMKPGDAIIGGFNYGMGSSRPAARSLRNCGVGFLLAETINGLFFRNCVNHGLRAFECPGVTRAFEEGDNAELIIEDWSVRNMRSGQTLALTPVPKMLLDMMLTGGIFPMLEARGLIAPKPAPHLSQAPV